MTIPFPISCGIRNLPTCPCAPLGCRVERSRSSSGRESTRVSVNACIDHSNTAMESVYPWYCKLFIAIILYHLDPSSINRGLGHHQMWQGKSSIQMELFIGKTSINIGLSSYVSLRRVHRINLLLTSHYIPLQSTKSRMNKIQHAHWKSQQTDLPLFQHYIPY